jgi:hypothetical protein
VEVATLSQVQSWVPGKNLALQTRKVLVAVHLVSINLVGIGERYWRVKWCAC